MEGDITKVYTRIEKRKDYSKNTDRNSCISVEKRKVNLQFVLILLFVVVICAALLLYFVLNEKETADEPIESFQISQSIAQTSPELIPGFVGVDYVTLNNNQPCFTNDDFELISGETFSELDLLGRCGVAYARINKGMMPTEERGAIGMIKPSGWHTVKYPDSIADKYLYNRCHLIAYALTGQNANELNLITGTRYMNISGMYQFERQVIEYLEETDDEVLYRVTPFFKDNELVARGVEMEAMSISDQGNSLCFHVFVYNYQPNIEIDYLTGDSRELN